MKTKTNAPITNQNDAMIRTASGDGITPLAYDDVLESQGTKYSYPADFQQIDDQHKRVPGTDASTQGAWLHTSSGGLGRQGRQATKSRALAPDTGTTQYVPDYNSFYVGSFGSAEMYDKRCNMQTPQYDDPSILTGSLSGGNRAANITQRKAVGTIAESAYNKASRN